MMGVVRLEVGEMAACCYIVSAPDAVEHPAPCVVIDPGAEPARITREVKKRDLRVEAVFLTHAHVDHIGGADAILKEWPGAVLHCSAETSRRAGDPRLNLSVYFGGGITAGPAGRTLGDGEEFSAAGLKWRAVEIPGHDPGEMVYILGDGRTVFTGDVLFQGSIGRSDFPGGDMQALVQGARALLEGLPGEGVIYPGHGPETRVRDELGTNPFLRGLAF